MLFIPPSSSFLYLSTSSRDHVLPSSTSSCVVGAQQKSSQENKTI